MEPIPENLVEKIWKEISGINPLQANEEIQTVGQLQPDLLAFVMDSTEELNPEAQELAIYLFFVVYRIFQASGAKIRKISSSEISECFDKNENLFESREAPNNIVRPFTIFPALIQPYVMKYVNEALMEEEGDTTIVSEEEKGEIFIVLKTVVEVLDQATCA